MLYYFDRINGMASRIVIDPDWEQYIHKNQEIIKGWLQYNLILYLQKRNPNVPGISDKLVPPLERKLEKVKKYWKLLISIEPIHEIYHDEIVTSSDISIEEVDIEELDAETVLVLLYCIIRQDRFHDGLILSCLENGMVVNLLKKLRKIDRG